MHINRKIIIYIILAMLALALGYGFLPKAAVVEYAEVKRGYMRTTIEEEGKTRVMNRFIISAPVAGFALRVDSDVGDFVNKGQTVTRLEPLRANVLDPRSRAEALSRVSAAEASLQAAKENAQAAKASAEFTVKELERIRQLHEDSLVTQEKLDEAETEVRRAKASLRSSEFAVDVARHEREAARTALKYSAAQGPGNYSEQVVITSPVNGNILKIHHESEGVVREGEALLEVGDPRALEVEIDVLSADAVRINKGMSVLFDRWGGDKPLKGKVRVVEPVGFTKISALGIEEQRVLVIADIVSPREEWTQLGDGYRVEASFILWEHDDVLQVPASTLFRSGHNWSVFIVENDRARLRSVRIGNRSRLSAQVISGLEKGDRVITHPDSSIEEGVSVRLHTSFRQG